MPTKPADCPAGRCGIAPLRWCARSRASSMARCRSSASAASVSGDDAREKISAGATLVQIYTGLIYRGPGLVAEIAQALVDEPVRTA